MLHLSHLKALLHKEIQQIISDKSVLIVAFFIPLCLVIMYGSGLRMDVKPISVVLQTSQYDDVIAKEVAFALSGSDYFTLTMTNNAIEADQLMTEHEVTAKITIPNNFAQSLGHIHEPIMITINGTDASQANLARSYIESALNLVLQSKDVWREVSYYTQVIHQSASVAGSSRLSDYQDITLIPRNWFNEGNNSTWYLMAGQLVAVVTLMSAFMTSIVVAREFERGTMDGLLSTNCTALEFLLSKIIPYYGLSIMGATCALLTAFILYALPFRGSFLLYVLTILVYLYLTMMIGLIISAVTQNQFLSSEYAVIVSFLPSILLSGALFDLRAIPYAINLVAHVLPPVYAVESFKICMLSGGSSDIVWRNLLILMLYSVGLTALCYKVMAKHFKRFPAQIPQNSAQKESCSEKSCSEKSCSNKSCSEK